MFKHKYTDSTLNYFKCFQITVQQVIEDFPWGDTNLRGEAPTYHLANLPLKRHGNKENWNMQKILICRSTTAGCLSQFHSISFVFLRFTRCYGFASSSKGFMTLCLKSKPCCAAGVVTLNTNRIPILILRAQTSLSFHYPVRGLPVLQKCS